MSLEAIEKDMRDAVFEIRKRTKKKREIEEELARRFRLNKRTARIVNETFK